MNPIRIAIVGLGKIARDQHVPSIAATQGVELVAVASRNASLEGVRNVATMDELLAEPDGFDAVSLCTPPQVRVPQALAAIHAGKHVVLEKPPGATVSEVEPLARAARKAGVTLFATWHSRFAPAVEPARALLAEHGVRSMRIDWMENVRKWHPGQEWIWEPGGLGVFDPGINALSIVTRILPRPMFLVSSDLLFPENRAAPIAADLRFSDEGGTSIRAAFDWRETGGETWEIRADTGAGEMVLKAGGTHLSLAGETIVEGESAEYRGIYRRFAELAPRGECDVDLSPLVHVADAFMLGRRRIVEAFVEA